MTGALESSTAADAAVEDNSHAGQGAAVVIDIGGDIGALVVTMPASMEGIEIEIRPVGADSGDGHGEQHDHGQHDSHPDHAHHEHADHSHHEEVASHGHHHHHGDDDHAHEHDHDHGGHGSHHPHVAVVARPTPTGAVIHSAVFPELAEGTYELYEKLGGPVRVVASVTGGEVAFATWPTD